ncbi:MAG: serine protease [Bacteroidales bacterium]|nr:serine protease [Bacteroidales bacterium]
MGNLTFIILLMIAGILFLLAELLIVPGVGLAGVFGLASMAGAAYFAFVQMGPTVGAIVTAIEIAVVIAVTVYALREKTWQKLALKTNIESKISDASVEVRIGQTGKTETRLAPMGTARFDGVAIEVKAMQGIIDAGTEVEIALIEDKKIYVKPLEDQA